MPHQSRLDAPETSHHVMVRGIERPAIFRDDLDRADFVAGCFAAAGETGWEDRSICEKGYGRLWYSQADT